MNLFAFALFAWILVGLEVGLKDAFQLGGSGIAPSFVLPFAVFIALGATANQTVWACLALGVAMDLTWSVGVAPGVSPEAPTIVGPYALGFALAGQLVLALRSMMVRRNPLTMAFLSLIGMAVAQVVVVAMYTARDIVWDEIVWSAGSELGRRLASAAYTGLTGFFLALVLYPLAGAFGLQFGPGRSGRR